MLDSVGQMPARCRRARTKGRNTVMHGIRRCDVQLHHAAGQLVDSVTMYNHVSAIIRIVTGPGSQQVTSNLRDSRRCNTPRGTKASTSTLGQGLSRSSSVKFWHDRRAPAGCRSFLRLPPEPVSLYECKDGRGGRRHVYCQFLAACPRLVACSIAVNQSLGVRQP